MIYLLLYLLLYLNQLYQSKSIRHMMINFLLYYLDPLKTILPIKLFIYNILLLMNIFISLISLNLSSLLYIEEISLSFAYVLLTFELNIVLIKN